MNKRIIKYFLLAIAISTTGSVVAYAQKHQHGEQHNDLRSRNRFKNLIKFEAMR